MLSAHHICRCEEGPFVPEGTVSTAQTTFICAGSGHANAGVCAISPGGSARFHLFLLITHFNICKEQGKKVQNEGWNRVKAEKRVLSSWVTSFPHLCAASSVIPLGLENFL